ncbi:MAG: hypothetical protein LBC87_07975 [Fibromonadaceae bacterium]|jgi:hypothetical protein|nr:hypothetical protein [Fibromonadaceae bacterium]
MFSKLKYALITAMLCLATANAATVAVLEITSNGQTGLTADETKFLTEELRRQARQLLPQNYSVSADTGDYVVTCTVGKLANLLTLTVKLSETSSGSLLVDFAKESADIKGLLDAIRENSPNLFAKITPKEEPAAIAVPVPEAVKDTQPAAIPTNIPAEPQKSPNLFWAGVGLEVLGAAVIGLGIYQNAQSSKYHSDSEKLRENVTSANYAKSKKEYDAKIDDMKSAETKRNIFYVAGSALLLGGVAVHIWF